MVLKAKDPRDGVYKYFIDKCLPFGASISCSQYRRFSNALRHIIEFQTGEKDAITNYLDDFLFLAILRHLCNELIQRFLDLCQELAIPVAIEKTEWAKPDSLIIFLGILLDGKNLCLAIPLEKQEKALRLLNDLNDRKKATIKQLQVLTSYLNFLAKAIVAGRTFTRHIYAKCAQLEKGKNGRRLKPYHHVALDSEFKFDCSIWRVFLSNYRNQAVCRPMIDLE